MSTTISPSATGQMATVSRIDELREILTEPRAAGARIALVPTMGAFHDGHLALMRAALERADFVVVSLFVNPAQFGPGEDLAAYPRDLARDAGLAAEAGIQLLWTPGVEDLYPAGFATTVNVDDSLSGVLCGASRGPEHFRGVATVVSKLFNCVEPEIAFFGQKDAQQAIVIRRMVRDLNFPVTVEVLPTVREPDGLAMSSRNAYLDPEARARAVALSRALAATRREAERGERSTAALVAIAETELRNSGVEPEYVEARNAEDLTPVAELGAGPVLVAIAARVGAARLIDNVILD